MARRPLNQPYTITNSFGVPDSYAKFGRHSGVDYGVPKGQAVFAPASGNLTNIVSPTGGNMVVIYDGKYHHRLMHNSAFIRGNGQVAEGDQVARAGSTGLSTGVHVHWDVNTEGTYPTSFNSFINPDQWLNTQGVNMEEIKKLREIAEARRQLLGKLESAAGVDTGKTEPDNGVDQAIANIDAKNKQINELKAQLGDADEANILGRALIKVITSLGYKK